MSAAERVKKFNEDVEQFVKKWDEGTVTATHGATGFHLVNGRPEPVGGARMTMTRGLYRKLFPEDERTG